MSEKKPYVVRESFKLSDSERYRTDDIVHLTDEQVRLVPLTHIEPAQDSSMKARVVKKADAVLAQHDAVVANAEKEFQAASAALAADESRNRLEARVKEAKFRLDIAKREREKALDTHGKTVGSFGGTGGVNAGGLPASTGEPASASPSLQPPPSNEQEEARQAEVKKAEAEADRKAQAEKDAQPTGRTRR